MTSQVSQIYSTQITSTISTLESKLREITQAQNELMEAIEKAKATAIPEQDLAEIRSNMNKISIYNTKLLSLKATMSMLSGRSRQLQERANKLKQIKLNYLSQVDTIRKLEQEKDQIIAAKTSISTPVPSPQPSIVIDEPSPSIPKLKTTIKKKKKSKREALIGADDDLGSWKPKRSLSQKDLGLSQ